jgi:DNA-binding response OmpR family regulator
MSALAENINEVLIADDDADDYKFLTSAIQDLTVTVIVSRAENGEILIKILNEKIPDVLFLDVLLPRMNGKECLKEIRSNRRYDSLPIIMYTSLRDVETIEFCYREGSNLYVCKPNSYSELLEILTRIFTIDWKKMMYYPPLSQYVLNNQ